MSSGDCSSSAADVRVRNSLLQFGFDQDAIIQCSASCVLCGWGFDSSDDVLGLQLEATGVVRAVNSNRVSVSVESFLEAVILRHPPPVTASVVPKKLHRLSGNSIPVL